RGRLRVAALLLPCTTGYLLGGIRMHAGNLLLDTGELGAGLHVAGAARQRVDLIVHVTDTVAWIGMVAQELCAALAALALDDLEELRQRPRIVARVVENVR